MPLQLPPQGDYQIILNGFFGNLSTDKRSALWTEFTTENNISSTNPPSDDATKEKFINFAETNYATLLQVSNDFSPDAVALRHVISNVFDVLITLMKTAQTTAATQSALGVFLANYQNNYTGVIADVPLYTNTSPTADPTAVTVVQTLNYDPHDASKTTFGSFAGGASLQTVADLMASNDLTKPQQFDISSPPRYILPQPTYSLYSDTINLVMSFRTEAADASGNVTGKIVFYTNFNSTSGQFNTGHDQYSFNDNQSTKSFTFNVSDPPAVKAQGFITIANETIAAHTASGFDATTVGPILLNNRYTLGSDSLPSGVVNDSTSFQNPNGFVSTGIRAVTDSMSNSLVFPWDDFYLKAYTSQVAAGTINTSITNIDETKKAELRKSAGDLRTAANKINQQGIQTLVADRTTISNDSDTNNTNLQTTLGDLTTLANLMKTTISQLRSVLASIYSH